MSKSIEQFNGLNGVVATREQLKEIADLSLQEEQSHIYARIQNVLSNNDDDKFEINIHDKAFEIAPKSMLNGLHFEEMTDEENNGLNKAVSSTEIYQMITDKMLAMIKEASGKGYIQKWSAKSYGKGYTIPFNFDSKKRYRGVNVFLLTSFEPLENPFFMTFKQIETHKGTLKKGSKGLPVVYFTNLYKITDRERNIDFGTYDINKAKEFASKNGFSEKEIKTLPILKYYNVFNGKDIEGVNFDLENFKIGYIEKELPNTENLPIAEAIIESYPTPAPKLKHGGKDAFYRPSDDLVQMPNIADFETIQDYYRTLFHEFSHSTGVYHRLDRDFSGRFGSKPYAFEELVAEWGATFLSAEAGIIWHSNKNHAEYLKNWNGALTHLKNDNKFIMRACTKAQELTDYILQFDDEGTPKYLKTLKIEASKIEVKKPVAKKVKKAITVETLLTDFVILCKEEMFDFEFKPTTKKFKAGDSYSSDFDYKGMLQAGTKVTKNDSLDYLEKLHSSFQDVNFHDASKPLWEAILLLRKTNKEKFIDLVSKDKSNTLEKLKERKKNNIVGYLLLDSISGDIVATKKTLKELKQVFDELEENEIGKGLEVFVYEIVKKSNKNQKGNRVLVDWKKEVKKPIEQPVKVDASGQTSLFGVKKVTPKSAQKKHSKISKIGLAGNDQESEFYTVAGEVGKFLQQVEKKPVESVVITMDGQQGAGKTTTLYKFMDSFAITGNKCLFLSLEEHPASSLAKDKVSKYLSIEAQENIDTVGEVESISELYDFIKDYEIIFIDSWQKLQRMVGAIRLDEDLRKKFNGKVFVVIFQQTTTGRTKGGAEVVFDGDIIIKMVKESSFAENYAYFDKNRYTLIAIEDIRYNIASGTCYNPNAKEQQVPATELQPVEQVEFNFVVK